MKLVKLPNKVLREKSKDVSFPLSEKIEILAKEMIKHVDMSQDEKNKMRPGVGISAVQLGQPFRMFYINLNDGEKTTFRDLIINPKIIALGAAEAALEGGEGCLSVEENKSGVDGLVHRKNKIIISGYSYFEKKEVQITKSGYLGIIFQHELDHLDGKLFFDRIDKKNRWLKKENEILI
ncbi:MAG: peptide deformylase [Mycoplasmataceae bacterium]|nr:peptide deformylase [Mycoplasmataceae bacterium]